MGYGKAYFLSATTCAQQATEGECLSDAVKIPGGGGQIAPKDGARGTSKFSGKQVCEPKVVNAKRNRNTKAMGKDPFSKWWLKFSEEQERMRRSKDWFDSVLSALLLRC